MANQRLSKIACRRTLRDVRLWLLVTLVACGNGGSTEPDPEEWTASMDAASVVRSTPVASDATGTANFSFDGTVLSYTIDVQSIDRITQAHIHGPASRTQRAPVKLWLFDPDQPTGEVNGRLVSGTVTEATARLANGGTFELVLRWMRTDSAHVMVHTTEYPGGEIRGQVVPQ